MDGKQLPKGTVVKETIERTIVIGGDDSNESIQLQNLSNPPPYSANPVGDTTNERIKEEPRLTEDLWGDVSFKCLLFFDLNRSKLFSKI